VKRRIVWRAAASTQYVTWNDRKMIRRINDLIGDIQRSENAGIGKPEPLRNELSGFWSRRIDQEHRLVYRLTKDDIEILACRFHYGR